MFSRIKTGIFILLLVGIIAASSPSNYQINLYLVPFENNSQNRSLDWLKNGLMDMVATHFQYSSLVKIHFEEDLNRVTRSKGKERQRLLSENQLHLLLVGNYKTISDTLQLELQLLDLTSWLSVDVRKLEVPVKQLSVLSDKLNQEVEQMLDIQYRLKFKKKKKKEEKVTVEEGEKLTTESPMESQGKVINQQLEVAVKNFENTLDKYLGIRETEEGRKTRQEGTYYIKTFTHRPFTNPNVNKPESVRSVREILNEISINPYKVDIGEPAYEGIPLHPDLIKVKIPVKYQLKANVISDLLEIVPLKNVEIGNSYKSYQLLDDIFYFDPNLNYSISRGDYRLFPIIDLINQEGNTIITILDIPATIYYKYEVNQLYESIDLITAPEYKVLKNMPGYYFLSKFKPKININSSLRSVNIYIDKKDMEEIVYIIDVPIEEMKLVSGARVHFEPESEIAIQYLR